MPRRFDATLLALTRARLSSLIAYGFGSGHTARSAAVADPALQRRLGRAVKQIRVARGLTQEQVSAASGLHPTYISDIERGARNPSWDAMARLADGIGVSVGEIGQRFDAEPADDAS